MRHDEPTAKITEDEAELYDRQIRLWGLDAQKRMRASDVLVVGLSGLTGEVIKNIVLAGINSLTVLDSSEVEERHMSAMFFVNKSHLHLPIATAALDSITKLNPLVKVTADTGLLQEKDADFFKRFHVVCMDSTSISDLQRVNNICRDYNIKFLCGSVFGFYGYIFSDLGDHEYSEQVKVPKAAPSDGPTKPKVPRREVPSKPEMETVTVKNRQVFGSFTECLSADFAHLNRRQRSRVSPALLVTRVLLKFFETHGRKPESSDAAELLGLKEKTLGDLGLQSTLLTDNFVSMVTIHEMSPVCAIVGGVLGQEILKAVSQKGAPLCNVFVFDPESGAGKIELLAKQQPTAARSTRHQGAAEIVEELVI